ncbi:MAG TPA: ABC transporter permease [Candidatus Bathyarchaeia archaeon]|nr:ABC transporter permease [Candidatus Bathyarchaeia archaeon]
MQLKNIKWLGDFWYKYRKNKAAVMGLVIVTAVVLIAITAPLLTPYGALQTSVGTPLQPPTNDHPLGTDGLGRDIFAGVVYGSRTALMVGLLATAIGAGLGTLVGTVSGYNRGKIDDILMRITESFIIIPVFFLALVLMAFLGQSVVNVIFVVGILSWPRVARLVRADFLTLREREFVKAARMDGASKIDIMVREILPNVTPTIIVASTLEIASAILYESSLSFLGLGDANVPSWGVMLKYAQPYIFQAWWAITFPGLAITILVLALNEMGDGLNDALNPRLKERK